MRSLTHILLVPIIFLCTSANGVSLSSSYTLHFVMLDNKQPFEQQIIYPNTTYTIHNVFDLKGKKVNIPEGCTMRFEGGMLVNGIVDNCGKIENEENTIIFKDVSFVSPQKQQVKLSWFSYSSDSESLENAARFGRVDCTGNWTINTPVSINNDIVIENGDFTCMYGVYNIVIAPSETHVIDYKKKIKKGSKDLFMRVNSGEADAVSIRSNDIYYKTGRSNIRNGTRGEVMKVKKKSLNKIAFDTKEGTICEYKTNIKLTLFRPLKVFIRGCRFHSVFKEDSDKGGVLVNIDKAIAEIKDCYFSGCSVGLALGDCIDSQVINCTFEKIYPWAAAFTGGTCNSTVKECTFNTNRHGWTTLGESGVVKNCTITHNKCKNSLIALCPHANAYNITISHNIVDNSQGGVGSFAPNSIIKNNQISILNGVPAVYLTEAGGINPTVEGNVIENCKGYSDVIRNYTVDLTEDICYIKPVFCLINYNTIKDCPDYSGITCDYSKVGAKVSVHVVGNVLDNVGYTAININAPNAVVTDNKINGIRRSSFVPISLQDSGSSPHKGNAKILRNVVSRCNSDKDVDIKGYDRVICHSNNGESTKLNVLFNDCRVVIER